MLGRLVHFALAQRVLVLALAALLVVLGVRAGRDVPLDVFPEFAPPMVEIQTEAPGLSTEEVESLVTVPIETAVNGVPGLMTLRSKSVLGLSSVQILFERGSDVIRARQMVGERIAQVQPRLPLAARQPVLMPPLSSTSRAMKVGLSSTKLDQMQLSELVRWTIRPRLMAVPGVANVAVWGQRDRQLQVLVDPDRLRASGVTLAEVRAAAGDAVLVGGGGFVDTPNQRLAVQQTGTVQTAADLARAIVKQAGEAPVRIGDVARVVDGFNAPIGNAIIDDGPGIMLIVEKQPTANTLELTRAVEAAFAELKPGLKDVKVDTTIFRPATFIERSIDNLTRALMIGCALVAAVLFLFTRDWRQATISLVAIPLSLLGAGLMLLWSGATINVMIIAGLVIALGEVVDDAIIDVENIARRLRLNRESADPKPAFAVVLAASLEVRSAVVFASLIVMLVFVPIFFLGGVAGTFFQPLAIAYVLAIGMSLLVALTVTPAMCLLLLPNAPLTEERDTRFVAGFKRRYVGFLPRVVGRPALAVGIVAGGLLLAGVGYATFKDQFLPDFRETDFLMHFVEKPGTSIEAMDRITIRASKELRSIPGVRNFGAHIGRAEQADEVVGPNFTELWISLDENADYDASVKRIKEVVEGYPGLYRDVLTYLRERIKEVLTGAGATIVVRIYGPDQPELRAAGARVRDAIGGIQGVSDLKLESQVLVPQIRIRPRAGELARLGLTAGEVRRQAQVLVAQAKVGEIYRDQRAFDVAVWGEPAVRNSVHALRDLMIQAPVTGAPVRLGDIAGIEIAPAPNEVKRENGQRRLDVTMNVAGADLGTVAQAVDAAVAKVPFATGYHPQVLGEYAALRESRSRLWGIGALCLVGILLLVWMEFRSRRITALVAVSLPFALVGGVVAVALTGGVLSLGSLVGFVTVIGIAARNGIMLLSHYQHLERHEGMTFGRELVLRGAEERLVPILMTAACAGLALVPLIVAGNAPGHEIEHPMAIVILGGLISSTALNLLLLPALYARYGEERAVPPAPASTEALA
ncbi:heavy metal efflux pump, CzcA family [Sphingomonas sp. OV641]|jgi:CzcA family heavy metal efflux pump|uniref:Efflux RND transporter permease subunit n=2 Tax=Sphingomonas TaxID=13687 RepID=A0ABX2JJN5_9SPHN|nr:MULTISPECIES: efflux RND transporter permease subunit [Sphingomonas]MBX8846737.1 efflux RND transporter permease subunit [Sphingomonas melonis]MBX8855697.1 efflux RND transporter permease subunit [Sphingomonas melonis]MBX8900710.1 efflux RND transporter permease subunit [Sphingomonas melonis]MDG5973450.1 efflux RND transporter permease subunit [Sphingomonas paucimobilis]NTS66653.1 efflux RND transporter permease subunit [Sphingomonas hominis]